MRAISMDEFQEKVKKNCIDEINKIILSIDDEKINKTFSYKINNQIVNKSWLNSFIEQAKKNELDYFELLLMLQSRFNMYFKWFEAEDNIGDQDYKIFMDDVLIIEGCSMFCKEYYHCIIIDFLTYLIKNDLLNKE